VGSRRPRWAGRRVRTLRLGPAAAGRGGVDGHQSGFPARTYEIRWLLERRLVDQIVLLTYPVIVGRGRRLFPATGPDIGLELVDLLSTPKGLTVQTYRTTGRPRYDTATG
jgi:hypothetical protein